MSKSVFRETATGAGLVSESFEVPTGAVYRLLSVTLNLSAAPTTSEDLTFTQNVPGGATHDTRLYTLDVAAGATTDVLWQPDARLVFLGGDSLDIDWTNTDTRTWGLLVTWEAM